MPDPENKPEETPAPKDDLGDAGKKALDAERKARREAEAALKNAEAELEKLRADSDSTKSEMDKVQSKIDALEKRAADAERKALVAEVAQAKKLPAAIAGRLTGSTKEELEADADELIEALGLNTEEEEPAPATGLGRPKEKLISGASTSDEEEPDYAKLAEEIATSNSF